MWSVEHGGDSKDAIGNQPQQFTMLSWGTLSERAQKIKGLNFCASQFVTEDEVKYCVAKLFSGDVKFATAADY